MNNFIARHPVWALAALLLLAVLLFLIFAIWPPELEQLVGRKRVFLNALLNGITLGGLYFMVASGFTLIFGLMRNVNLAHGSLYLLGGYVGYEIAVLTGAWLFSLVVAFVITTPDAPEQDELERQVIEHCAGQLAGFKVPRAVYVVDEFPLGTLDKLLKNKLRDLADEQPAID